MSTPGKAPTADSAALDQIAALLRADAAGEWWGPEPSDAIAEIVRATGRDTGGAA